MRGDASLPDPAGLAVTVVILVAVASAGVLVVDRFTDGEFQKEIQQEQAEAKAYCQQVYGDNRTINAMVSGGHGGLHCVGNEHGPHLHDIPDNYIHTAYYASQNGTDLGWGPETARQQAVNDRIPLVGLPQDSWTDVLGITLVVAVAAMVIGLLRRYRDT